VSLPPRSVLERCLGEPGYTPPQASLPELLTVLSESAPEEREPLERAIARAGGAAVTAVLSALDVVTEQRRPPLLALAARLCSQVREPSPRAALRAVLASELEQGDPAFRKWAARGLGKLGDTSAEPSLLRALLRSTGTETKSLVDALGALGGAASLAALRRLTSSDADLQRRRERALLLIERRASRERAAVLALDRPLGRSWPIVLTCRAGLADLLGRELVELGLLAGGLAALGAAPAARATRLVIDHAGSLRALLASRLAIDVALSIPLDAAVVDPVERIAAALTRRDTLEALASWCDGSARFRVAWSDGGHHRSRAWALAQSVRRRSTEIVNDSQRALWTARVRSDGEGPLELQPRLDPDPRFAYRVSEVRAASHPTLAAALARFAGVQEQEVVWDPFVGSGLELVERARLAPVAELWGSDIDARALTAARANLDAAGLGAAQLVERSALEFAPLGVSLILTNPPMGRRLARDGSLAELLEQFVRHAASVLRPKGRLVWLSPLARQTERAARAAGLEVSNGPDVDLGGFDARLQTCTRKP
jgi:predicted RNA methylase